MAVAGLVLFCGAVVAAAALALCLLLGYRKLSPAERDAVAAAGLWHVSTSADVANRAGCGVVLSPRRCRLLHLLMRRDTLALPTRAVYFFTAVPTRRQLAFNVNADQTVLLYVAPHHVPATLYRRPLDGAVAARCPVPASGVGADVPPAVGT